MNNDICGNCKLFNDHKKMINGNYECKFHGFTVAIDQNGCYKIQFNKKEI